MSESQKKLFKGQNTHPLSQAEKQALAKKLTFDSTVSKTEKNKIYAAFKEMMDYPTGREQIRKIITAPQEKYNIVVKKLNARGYTSGNNIFISDGIVNDPKQCGMTMLHELLHQRQKANNMSYGTLNIDQVANIIMTIEAETKALSAQLEVELNHNTNLVLKQNYEKNIEKWRQVADGKQPLPKNVPALIYEPNLTAAEKEQAKEEYAKLLASLETRANMMKDYTRPFDEFNCSDYSYAMLHQKSKQIRSSTKAIYNFGKDPDCMFKNPEGNPEFCEEILKDVTSRNSLFLTVDDLEKATADGNNDKEKIGFMTIAREAQARFAKGEGKNFTEVFDKIVAEKQKAGKPVEIFIPTNNNNQVYSFFDKEMYPAGKGLEGAAAQIKENEAIQKTKMLDDNQKIELLLERIKNSKNANLGPCEERTDAIKRLQEMTGNPNLPIVKTSVEASVDSQVQEALRRSGKPVPPVEEISPCLTPDKSLMA